MLNKIVSVMLLFVVSVSLIGCGQMRHAGNDGTQGYQPVLKPLSHNDSLRLKYFYLEAMSQQTAGNYATAYDMLRHCLRINPNAAEVHYALSFYDGGLNSDSMALADVKRATELSPANNYYMERLAEAYIKTGDLQRATETYEKLYERNPGTTDLLDMLLKLYYQTKDYEKAIATIERTEKLDGSTENTAITKMHLLSMMDRKEEALQVLKTLSQEHPYDLNYRVMTGNWLLQNDRPEEALQELTYVLEQDPENSSAQMSMLDYYKAAGMDSLANVLRIKMLMNDDTPPKTKLVIMNQIVDDNERGGKDSTAVLNVFRTVLRKQQKTPEIAELYAAYMALKRMPQDSVNNAYKHVLQIAPDNVTSRLQLIDAYMKANELDSVIVYSKPAAEYHPDELAFYYYLGFAYMQKDMDDETLDVFTRGVKHANSNSNPDIVSDFYAVIGDICHLKGLDKEAFAAYDSCLQWKADNIGCLNNYAYYLSLTGDSLAKAEQMSYKTIKAEPGNGTYLDTYAWILFKQQRYAEAQIYIEQALKADSADLSADVLEHAGDIYVMNNNIDMALEYWRKALEKNPDSKVLIRKIKLRKYINDEK